MSKANWIKRFQPIDREGLLASALETAAWIEQYGHFDNGTEKWDVLPGKRIDKNALLLSDIGLYGGAAGVVLLYIRLYTAVKDDVWLKKADAGLHYIIGQYNGISDFTTKQTYLPGAYIGFYNGPAGGAYVAEKYYELTGKEEFKNFAVQVTDDCIAAAHTENGALTWYGFYGILGEGSLILYLIDAYENLGEKKYLEATVAAGRYLINKKEDAPGGGYRWYAMPTDTFPTIQKAGGYFPGFEYGTAGCGYILACIYEHTKEKEFLKTAEKAAEYILNIADYSEDGQAALVKYNDPYLPDLYYLGVCQGPVGTSRLFFKLYQLTQKEKYRDFVIKLTNGLLAAGAPAKHSEGYWRTNCYCCGAAGMLEHFINVHRFTGEKKYFDAAYETAETIIGDSTHRGAFRNWYTAWNRHEPETSEAYTGLYHGSGGCASSLLMFAQYLGGKKYFPPYLEDPYKILFK